jgi:hypothetical protein
MQDIIDQLQPQVKRASHELRMRIVNQARYHSSCPNQPYSVRWDGQTFYSDDTMDLVDQVIAWLKLSKEERAKRISEGNGGGHENS